MYKKKNFPRGTFVVVMDYAENGDLRTGRRTEGSAKTKAQRALHWASSGRSVS
jgi:hypothetical protein